MTDDMELRKPKLGQAQTTKRETRVRIPQAAFVRARDHGALLAFMGLASPYDTPRPYDLMIEWCAHRAKGSQETSEGRRAARHFIDTVKALSSEPFGDDDGLTLSSLSCPSSSGARRSASRPRNP